MDRTTPKPSMIIAATVFFCVLAVLAGCQQKKPEAAPPPPKVTVVQPLERSATYYIEVTGTTQAINTVTLVARVAGYLQKVFFHDGQMVDKGELLFLIEQDNYREVLKQTQGQVLTQKAQLRYAQSQLTRYSNLLPAKAAAQSDVDNWRYQRDSAEANLKTAQANEAVARLNLGYTEVRAPFAGRIDRRLQDPGNLVGSATSNANLAQLSQIDPLYIYFNVSDSDLTRLMRSAHWNPGAAEAVRWPVFAGIFGEEGYPRSGRLDFASISVTATTGTLLMRGVFPNAAGKMLPGSYARVRVPVETRQALLVPATAVGSDQQGSYVLVVGAQDVVERRNVKAGPMQGDRRVIEEGLSGKESIVASALLKARPGARVVPVPEQGDGPPPARGLSPSAASPAKGSR